MKHKIILVMALFAIIATAFCIWNWSFQLERIIHIDHAIIDAFSGIVLCMGFVPSGLLAEKKEDVA